MTETGKSLFNHFLQHRLSDLPEWGGDSDTALAQLQALYNEKKALLSNFNEAQTEQDFIQPALDVLGFAYTVQTSVSRAGQAQRPCYALFADVTQKTAADKYIKDEKAFCPRAQFENRNPSFPIVNYPSDTAVDWGILTNGLIWHLYYRQANSTANEFYEVDLAGLLKNGDPEAFECFRVFFRREAFVKDKDSRNFLERVRDGSASYTRASSDELKERVFAKVYPLLVGGFVANMARHRKDPARDDAPALICNAHPIQQASSVDVQGRPALTRIQVTDALVDEKLYGLTEEEIAIVEREA